MTFKKLSLAALAISSLITAVSAQNSQSGNNKFSANDRNIEVQLAPFSATDSPISLNGFKFRYFNSENTAIRLNANITSNSSTEITQAENSDLDLLELKKKTSSFQFMIAPGYEMHFSGTDRLSPYIGGEAVLDYLSNSTRTESQQEDAVKYTKDSNSSDDAGHFGFSLNGVAGFDFYFTKSLYLGAEVNYGLNLKSNLSTKQKSDTKDYEAPDPVKNGSSFSFQPGAMGQFKLGFLF